MQPIQRAEVPWTLGLLAGGALALAACSGGEEEPIPLPNAAEEEGAGVLLELDDDRPRELYLECSEPEGCDINLGASLRSPDGCELFTDGEDCGPGVDEPVAQTLASMTLAPPSGDPREAAIEVQSDGRTVVDGGELTGAASGRHGIEIARAPGVDRPLSLFVEASWRAHSDPDDEEPGDSEENLLVNAGFEAGEQEDGCPEAWTCATYQPANAGSFSVDDAEPHRGAQAARWSAASGNPATVIRQIHPASPGTTYEASAWVRTEGLAEAPYVQVLFEDAGGDLLATERFTGEAGTRDWMRIEGETAGAPAGASRVRFNLSTDGTSGAVWWDDAALRDAGPGETEPLDGVELCDLGLSDGDLINPYLEDHVTDGETVIVCSGTYDLSSLSLSANDWTLIAPEGATLRATSTSVLNTQGARYRVSGFVFDQTAPGARLSFNPAGDDWVLERLAWRGESPGGAYLMAPSVDSVGATGLVDQVYMGDGQVEGTESGGVWVNANRGHYGDLTFRRAYIAHFVDNGLYASGPPTKGQPGKTHVEDSYFWSNTISNARTGAVSGPCYVRGSVFVLDDTTQACGTGCSNPGARTTRAVWSWYGEVVVEDSDFTITHGQRLATTQGGTITEVGNRVGAAASTQPPPGVPTSPEDILQSSP